LRAIILLTTLAVAGCSTLRDVYRDPSTGFSVRDNERQRHGIGLSTFGLLGASGDRGEPGPLHPAVLEYVMAAEEGPLARYYHLLLQHSAPPERAMRDLAMLQSEATRLAASEAVRGHHYARALAQRISRPVLRALAMPGRYGGCAGVYWGVPADIEAGVLLPEYEYDEREEMRTVIQRYQGAEMVVVHSDALYDSLAWDLSAVPGAFDAGADLDFDTVAATIVPLHAAGEASL